MSEPVSLAAAVVLGVGLAAASGLRVFLPAFLMSLATSLGLWEPRPEWAWLASPVTLVGLGVAVIAELLAYAVPAVDNLLDAIAVPAATVAGSVLLMGMAGDVGRPLHWVLAIIAGGGVAGTTALATAKLRALSTITTAGTGNWLFAAMESVGAAAITVSVLLGVGALLVCLVTLAAIVLALRRVVR